MDLVLVLGCCCLVCASPRFRASLPSCQTAQTAVCRHHRRVIAHPLQHGGREEGVRGGRGGEVCGFSGGERKQAPEAGSGIPLCQGKRAVCVKGRGPLPHRSLAAKLVPTSPRRWEPVALMYFKVSAVLVKRLLKWSHKKTFKPARF